MKGSDIFGLNITIKFDFCKEENKIQLKKFLSKDHLLIIITNFR